MVPVFPNSAQELSGLLNAHHRQFRRVEQSHLHQQRGLVPPDVLVRDFSVPIFVLRCLRTFRSRARLVLNLHLLGNMLPGGAVQMYRNDWIAQKLRGLSSTTLKARSIAIATPAKPPLNVLELRSRVRAFGSLQ